MRKFLGVAALATAMSLTAAAQAQYLIIGNDEKVAFDEGKQVLSPPGNDTVTIVDISRQAAPRRQSTTRKFDRRPADQSTNWRWSPIRSTWSRTATI